MSCTYQHYTSIHTHYMFKWSLCYSIIWSSHPCVTLVLYLKYAHPYPCVTIANMYSSNTMSFWYYKCLTLINITQVYIPITCSRHPRVTVIFGQVILVLHLVSIWNIHTSLCYCNTFTLSYNIDIGLRHMNQLLQSLLFKHKHAC